MNRDEEKSRAYISFANEPVTNIFDSLLRCMLATGPIIDAGHELFRFLSAFPGNLNRDNLRGIETRKSACRWKIKHYV